MKLQQTKSGKIHLASDIGLVKCTINKKNPGGNALKTVEKEIPLEEARNHNNFCFKCFGNNPHSIIAPWITPAPKVEIHQNQPAVVPEPEVKVAPAPEPKREPRKVVVSQSPEMVNAIYGMIEKLEAFSKDETKTNYKRLKASYYIESFYAIKDMLETRNVEAINRVMDRLVERGKGAQ